MSLLDEFNKHLELGNDCICWVQTGQPAGDRQGTGKSLRFQGVRYDRRSVVDALKHQDASLLEPTSLVSAKRPTTDVVAQLRLLLGKATSVEEAGAILRVIEIAEGQGESE